jgi:ATP-dependent protease Clp ATPase subunit
LLPYDAGNGDNMANDYSGPSRCSFCGKLSIDANHLVKGNNAAICDECVSILSNLMQDAKKSQGNKVRQKLFKNDKESRH